MAKRLAPGAFHSAATFARGSRPRAPGQKSRRHPARGPLRGTGAACSRQATPGSAPASQWLAAVPAAREELDGVCRSAQAHRALRAGSWLPLGRCPSAPAAPAPVATPRSVPLALALGACYRPPFRYRQRRRVQHVACLGGLLRGRRAVWLRVIIRSLALEARPSSGAVAAPQPGRLQHVASLGPARAGRSALAPGTVPVPAPVWRPARRSPRRSLIGCVTC